MAYIKYKEVTKYFYFSRVVSNEALPQYVNDYRYEDEEFLVSYRTTRDYGIFTNQRILLFDNTTLLGIKKEITSVPYASISTCSAVFRLNGADLSIMLDSGYPVRIKFVKMSGIDKRRLRYIYSCLVRAMSQQRIIAEDVRILKENDIKFPS